MPTGTCLILVTPDSERTMCTFLGTAGKINENDVDANAIKKSEIIFLEGYLWDEGDPRKAFDVILNSKTRRTGICGAAECLLINKDILNGLGSEIVKMLLDSGVEVRADKEVAKIPGTCLLYTSPSPRD